MDSRKYQLQKQIIDALKQNDNDLYSILKSQWAHRFGVESLEELKNLDLNQLNQNSTNLNNQKIDQSQNNSIDSDKEMFVEDVDKQEKEIKIKEFKSIQEVNDESFETTSYEIVDKENYVNKVINQVRDNKSQPKVEPLVPLPPKPKYGYFKKWLLRNKV